MLGVTTALTTDVPAIPLLWVLSLAIYLISFILVFAKRPPISHAWMVRREPFLILAGLIPTVAQSKLVLSDSVGPLSRGAVWRSDGVPWRTRRRRGQPFAD